MQAELDWSFFDVANSPEVQLRSTETVGEFGLNM